MKLTSGTDVPDSQGVLAVTNEEARQLAARLLGGGSVEKTARAEDVDSNDVIYALGKERLGQLYKEAMETAGDKALESGVEKVASACVELAMRAEVLDDFIKQAAGADAEYGAALAELIYSNLGE